jgi:hypothetical protein
VQAESEVKLVKDIAFFAYSVRDVPGAVRFYQDFPNCRACFVSDPEGNRFALHQMKKG